ncbi:MAG: ribosomal protein L13e [Nitrososphaerota archaeon]|jgi:large subunit ribosomal protein L13e|nr:ribosomal protein L13e [Nitrososphaerota archaeon]
MHHIKPSILKPNGKQKQGKGFSLNELKAAGISKQQAQKAGLPVDVRRKSQHDQNIEAIKAHIKKP